MSKPSTDVRALCPTLQKVSGLPEQAVPAVMARKLQPYVAKMQKDGYDDRMHL